MTNIKNDIKFVGALLKLSLKSISLLLAGILLSAFFIACGEVSPTTGTALPATVVTSAPTDTPVQTLNPTTTQPTASLSGSLATGSTRTPRPLGGKIAGGTPTPMPAGFAPTITPIASFYHFVFNGTDFFVHMPTHFRRGKPLPVVVAIHGMGSNGQDFAQPLIPLADEQGMLLVAPTMQYDKNFVDPTNIAVNDAYLLPRLDELLGTISARIQYPISDQVFLFGFSRGGQIVHRYAMFYPEKVRGVAVISAGNYTLPTANYPQNPNKSVSMPFPFGVADLSKYTGNVMNMEAFQKINFWIGVGGADISTDSVPAAWSPYIGVTRLDRATNFAHFLQGVGLNVSLNIFPNVGHAVCNEMKQGAFAFFNNLQEQ